MRSEKWDVGSVKLGQALRSLALKSTPHTSHLSHHNNKLQFIGENRMINIFIRVLILYILVLITMRLMGKREIRANATI